MAESRTDVARILWSARMDAACDQWHLTERAIPALRALVKTDPRMLEAIEEIAKAERSLDYAREALGVATALVERSE